MADKKTELMARFYAECQKKGYTDMTNDKQSLKAKVIATDLKLNYGNIKTFYEKAKICYEQVQDEREFAKELSEIRQQKEERDRIKRLVNGELLVTLSDRAYESDETTSVRVYIRPDNSIYHTVNNSEKIEGAPKINIIEGGVVLLTYHPSEAVYTGATVGGITTGGVHYTQSGYTAKKTNSGKGDIKIVTDLQTFTLSMIYMTDYTCNLFKRDEIFKSVVQDKKIKCYVESELADAYYSTVKSAGLNYQQISYALTAAADAQRLSYFECERIVHLLGRIVYGKFPPSDEQIYESAKRLENASTSAELNQAIELFSSISDYKDAEKRADSLSTKYENVLQSEKEQAILEKEEKKKHRKKKTLLFLLSTIAIVAAIIVLVKVIIPTMQYNAAKEMIENQQYEDAILAFQKLGDYRDSTSQIEKCDSAIMEKKYNDAVALIKTDATQAFEALTALGSYKDSAEKAHSIYEEYKLANLNIADVGDYIFWGTYEQDNNTENGKEYIEWLVLAKEDNKVLVISKYVLDAKPYNTSCADVTWETCSVRKWLNNSFITKAFSVQEQSMIAETNVSADKNPEYRKYRTDPGNATQDKVFLLSRIEVNEFFSAANERQCEPTEYAVANGAYVGSDNSNCSWFLRSPGRSQITAGIIDRDGGFGSEGGRRVDQITGVRPTLWISLGS